MGPSEDRRRFPRINKAAILRAQVVTYTTPQTKKEISVCLDVGGGGLRFRASEAYPVGTLLKIETEIPGWGQKLGVFDSVSQPESCQFVALGEVVRAASAAVPDDEVAVQFVALHANDHRSLVPFVQQLRELEKLEQEN